MNKNEQIRRKMQQKMKDKRKYSKLNIDTLKREIFAYQFKFNQQPWNQILTEPKEHEINAIRTKEQRQTSPEIKHEN